MRTLAANRQTALHTQSAPFSHPPKKGDNRHIGPRSVAKGSGCFFPQNRTFSSALNLRKTKYRSGYYVCIATAGHKGGYAARAVHKGPVEAIATVARTCNDVCLQHAVWKRYAALSYLYVVFSDSATYTNMSQHEEDIVYIYPCIK